MLSSRIHFPIFLFYFKGGKNLHNVYFGYCWSYCKCIHLILTTLNLLYDCIEMNPKHVGNVTPSDISNVIMVMLVMTMSFVSWTCVLELKKNSSVCQVNGSRKLFFVVCFVLAWLKLTAADGESPFVLLYIDINSSCFENN